MKNKSKKDGMKLMLLLLGGGVVGFSSSFIFYFMDDTFELSYLFSQFANHLVVNIIWYQLGIAGLLLIPTLYWLQKSKYLVGKENEEIDAEEDNSGILFDKLLSRSQLVSNVSTVFSFVLYGISLDFQRNPYIIGSIVVFLVFIVLAGFIEVKIVRLVQQQDPLKKGEPTSFKFQKQWVESCDEAEKMVIYKSAYQTFALMQFVMIGGLVVTLISKLEFETGNFPIVLVGGIWLIQIVSYFYYAKRNDKTRK